MKVDKITWNILNRSITLPGMHSGFDSGFTIGKGSFTINHLNSCEMGSTTITIMLNNEPLMNVKNNFLINEIKAEGYYDLLTDESFLTDDEMSKILNKVVEYLEPMVERDEQRIRKGAAKEKKKRKKEIKDVLGSL